MNELNANTKIYKIQPGEERYIDKFFDVCQLHEFIIPQSQYYNRFIFMENVYNYELNQNTYDIEKDNFNELTTYDDLLKYHKDFIVNSKDGIRTHMGPLSYETNFIKNELIKFYDKNVITTESEPGLVLIFSDGNYTIQKPYLFVIFKRDACLLSSIYDEVASNPMITLLDYKQFENAEIYKSFYPNIKDIDSYEFMFFGMRNPNKEEMEDPELMEQYFDYVFSNDFFKEILEMF